MYDFAAGHFVLKKGDKVMVVTENGPAIGCVCTDPRSSGEERPDRKLKKIFRLATPDEIRSYEKGCRLEREVYQFCRMKVKERSLPMRLVSVERRFDGSKVVVYFTADGRVDFRQLVKDLVGRFRTRIEMRQIGVRHQAKMVGGLGSCGRPLCCSSFLNSFDPVTIKMAKKQNISLNPNKISGMCGRLMCCLSYEYEYYAKIKKKLPKIGKRVKTKAGEGKVIRQNILKETLTVALDSGEEIEIEAKGLSRVSVSHRDKGRARKGPRSRARGRR